MADNPYFKDPEKQKRLEEAIRYGFIAKDPMTLKYTLTPAGMERWKYEMSFKR